MEEHPERPPQVPACRYICFGCGGLYRNVIMHFNSGRGPGLRCTGWRCRGLTTAEDAQAANDVLELGYNSIKFIWKHPEPNVRGWNGDVYILGVGDLARVLSVHEVETEKRGPLLNPYYVDGASVGIHNRPMIDIHKDGQGEYEIVLAKFQQAQILRQAVSTAQLGTQVVYPFQPDGHGEYGRNNGYGGHDDWYDDDYGGGGYDSFDVAGVDVVMGEAGDQADDGFVLHDDALVGEHDVSRAEVPGISALTEDLRAYLPFILECAMDKQREFIKLLKLHGRDLGNVGDEIQLRQLLESQVVNLKSTIIMEYHSELAGVERKVLSHVADMNVVLQNLVQRSQELGGMTDFRPKVMQIDGVEHFSDAIYCHRMRRRYKEFLGEGMQVRQAGELEAAPFPLVFYSDKTDTKKNNISLYPLRVTSPLIGTTNMARGVSELLAWLPVMRNDSTQFAGMNQVMRKDAINWVTLKCFEKALAPLKEASRYGVRLQVEHGGERYWQRFYPFPLYIISDIQEDWMLMCISQCMAWDHLKVDLTTLASVADLQDVDSLARPETAEEQANSSRFERRTEVDARACILALRNKNRELLGSGKTYADAREGSKDEVKDMSLSLSNVFCPEIVGELLPSGCKIVDYVGKGDTVYTYADMPYAGWNPAFKIDCHELVSPDPLHVLQEGIAKDILKWMVVLANREGSNWKSVSKLMSASVDQGSWVPVDYLGKSNLPRTLFEVVDSHELVYGVHWAGLLRMAQVGCAHLSDSSTDGACHPTHTH